MIEEKEFSKLSNAVTGTEDVKSVAMQQLVDKLEMVQLELQAGIMPPRLILQDLVLETRNLLRRLTVIECGGCSEAVLKYDRVFFCTQ